MAYSFATSCSRDSLLSGWRVMLRALCPGPIGVGRPQGKGPGDVVTLKVVMPGPLIMYRVAGELKRL